MSLNLQPATCLACPPVQLASLAPLDELAHLCTPCYPLPLISVSLFIHAACPYTPRKARFTAAEHPFTPLRSPRCPSLPPLLPPLPLFTLQGSPHSRRAPVDSRAARERAWCYDGASGSEQQQQQVTLARTQGHSGTACSRWAPLFTVVSMHALHAVTGQPL